MENNFIKKLKTMGKIKNIEEVFKFHSAKDLLQRAESREVLDYHFGNIEKMIKKTKPDALERFKELGEVYVTTDDGSAGVKGVVTAHPRMQQPSDMVYCCGPKPMMVAVSAAAARVASPCEVSLENMMACGLGACLCCVEKTVRGNVCVCTEGPVFNSTQLTWHD